MRAGVARVIKKCISLPCAIALGIIVYALAPARNDRVVLWVLDHFRSEHGPLVEKIARKASFRQCEIIARDVGGEDGEIDSAQYYSALEEIAQYARRHKQRKVLVNISFGGYALSGREAGLIRDAGLEGAVIVAAAGNSGTCEPHYPAAFAETIAVASVDFGGNRRRYSNYGSWITLAVEEKDVKHGTSFSSPRVAGAIAIALAERDLDRESLMALLFRYCREVPQLGAGRLNLHDFLWGTSVFYRFYLSLYLATVAMASIWLMVRIPPPLAESFWKKCAGISILIVLFSSFAFDSVPNYFMALELLPDFFAVPLTRLACAVGIVYFTAQSLLLAAVRAALQKIHPRLRQAARHKDWQYLFTDLPQIAEDEIQNLIAKNRKKDIASALSLLHWVKAHLPQEHPRWSRLSAELTRGVASIVERLSRTNPAKAKKLLAWAEENLPQEQNLWQELLSSLPGNVARQVQEFLAENKFHKAFKLLEMAGHYLPAQENIWDELTSGLRERIDRHIRNCLAQGNFRKAQRWIKWVRYNLGEGPTG